MFKNLLKTCSVYFQSRNDKSLSYLGILSIIASSLCFFSFLSYLIMTTLIKPKGEIVSFPFITVTTDKEGHSIAGVSIYINNTLIGVTDTFGRFKHIITGNENTEVHLQFEKKADKRDYFSHETIIVPKKSLKNQEIVRTIRLQEKTISAPLNRLFSNEKKMNEDFFAYDEIWFKNALENSTRQQTKEVLRSLKTKSKQIGFTLKEKSRWQVKIFSINTPPFLNSEKFILRIVTKLPSINQHADFLVYCSTNYSSCAQKILTNLKEHAPYFIGKKNKTFLPEQAPSKNYEQFTIVLDNVSSKEHNVYISGYKAFSNGKNAWTYWGIEKKESTLSIIKDDYLVYRKIITPKKIDHYTVTPQIALAP